MAVSTFNVLSLFSGIAGLDLGIRLAVPAARTVCYVEREAYAAAVLVARMQDGSLDQAPVWSDVCTFDGRPWRGKVDCVAGGFPCQDISNAGKRRGISGERSGLWSEYLRIVREVCPRWVFIENVSALRTRGLDVVLEGLASLGFDAEWGCFTAAEAGAPHRRQRLFLLAHSHSHRRESERGGGLLDGERATLRHDANGRRGADVADSKRLLLWEQSRGNSGEGGTDTAFPPGPCDDWETWDGPPPCVRRGADGLGARLDRLRALGNGVVPQQAARAFRELMSRFR